MHVEEIVLAKNTSNGHEFIMLFWSDDHWTANPVEGLDWDRKWSREAMRIEKWFNRHVTLDYNNALCNWGEPTYKGGLTGWFFASVGYPGRYRR